MDHDALYERAIQAVKALFGDTSVSQGRTKQSLECLIEEIRYMIETLDDE